MDWRPCTLGPFASPKGTRNSRRRSTSSSCSLSAPTRKLERSRIQKMTMTQSVNQSPGRKAIPSLTIPILLLRWKSPSVRLGAARALSPIFAPQSQRKCGPNQCSVVKRVCIRGPAGRMESGGSATHTHKGKQQGGGEDTRMRVATTKFAAGAAHAKVLETREELRMYRRSRANQMAPGGPS